MNVPGVLLLPVCTLSKKPISWDSRDANSELQMRTFNLHMATLNSPPLRPVKMPHRTATPINFMVVTVKRDLLENIHHLIQPPTQTQKADAKHAKVCLDCNATPNTGKQRISWQCRDRECCSRFSTMFELLWTVQVK